MTGTGPGTGVGSGTGPEQGRPLLVDRYEVGEVIGRGGMAEVHRGRDLRLGRTVAIKVLRVDLVGDATFQERFRREAQASASLNHPHIVAVYDTGEDVHRGVRVPFIVMEYVEGHTLRELLRDGPKITHERALEVTADICDALDYSHRAGIVHRDIKPGNVMVTAAGQIKVMDFGIARALASVAQSMTQTAMVVGTAQYLSPEQARGETADTRSDLYSTGCVLFELLAGRPPFVGDTLVSVAMAHVKEPPVAPSTLDPTISRDIDAIVLKALAKERTDRYQSAADMARDVRRALSGVPVTASPAANAATAYLSPAAVAAAASVETASQPAYVSDELEDEPGNRTNGWLIFGILAMLVIGGIAGYLLFKTDPVMQVRVPKVVDMTVEQARAEIEAADLLVGTVVIEPSDDVAEGEVVSQDPDASTLVNVETAVNLVVSGGVEQRVVPPNLIGQTEGQARAALEAQNFVVKVDRESSNRPAGTVLAVDPPEGSTQPLGTTVTITVSSGEIEVPGVVGESESSATATLRAAGFEVDTVTEPSDEAAGTVLRQTPAAGSLAEPESTVVLTIAVALPPEPTVEPTPTVPPDADDTPAP